MEDSTPGTTALFEDFCAGPARTADELLIIGDLFEAWPGDDCQTTTATRVGQALRDLSQFGVAVGFMHGNRDFLIGQAFCQRWGIDLIDQPLLRRYQAGYALILHGDQLCTDDIAYQRWRSKVRDPAWQQRILSRPLWWRLGLARAARLISRLRHRRQMPQDVSQQAVEALMNTHQAQLVIHGHTHRPAVHGPLPSQRIVLSDWTPSTGSAVVLTHDEGGDSAVLMRIHRDGDGVALQVWDSR